MPLRNPARALKPQIAAALQRAGWRRGSHTLVALLCIALVLFLGAAQVLHTHGPHAADEAQNPNCSLCSVAHLAALPIPFLDRPVAVETVTPVRAPDQAQPPPRQFTFSTLIRPPPAV